MKEILFRFFVFLVALLAMIFAPMALAQEEQPAPGLTNYQAVLNASTVLQIANLQTQAERAKAQAQALVSCAKFASELAQVMCAGFATGAIGGGMSYGPQPASFQLPAPPPEPVKVEQGNWLQALVNAPAALLDGAVKVAPMVVQYLLGKVNAQAQVAMAVVGAQERSTLYTTLGGMHAATVSGMQGLGTAGFNSVQQVAQQGFITIGALPPTYQYTVNGSHAINFGGGALTYNPINNSYNPVNPNPRVCSGSGATFVCN